MRNITQNLFFCLDLQRGRVLVAAGVLYPDLRTVGITDLCGGRDEFIVDLGHRQCLAATL